MIKSKLFEVGDVVVVNGGWGTGAPRKVKRIMKRWLELVDGTKWTLSGNPYPRGCYDREFIVHYTETLREERHRHLALGKLRALCQPGAKYTADQLEAAIRCLTGTVE
jgi:hypothetical protein